MTSILFHTLSRLHPSLKRVIFIALQIVCKFPAIVLSLRTAAHFLPRRRRRFLLLCSLFRMCGCFHSVTDPLQAARSLFPPGADHLQYVSSFFPQQLQQSLLIALSTACTALQPAAHFLPPWCGYPHVLLSLLRTNLSVLSD